MRDSRDAATPAGAVPEDRLLPIERSLLKLSAGSQRGFLALRLVLAVVLAAQLLAAPDPSRAARWMLAVPLAYAGAAWLLYRLRESGRITDAQSLATFVVDITASLAVMRFVEGGDGSNAYTALLLLIIGSCLLQRPLAILAVSVTVGLFYAFHSLPATPATLHIYYLRLSLFLLIALFSAHITDYAALVERQTARRYEERLAWMQRLSLVGKAMAAVLHETKTPLGAVLLNAESAAELVRAGKDPGAELRAVVEQAEQASAVLQNFLDFVKPSRLELEPLDLAEPLGQALAMAKVRLEERGVRVELKTRTGCAVKGSRRHLLQAFANVINNAVDAMPEGGALAVRLDKRGGEASVRFDDTGVGLSAEDLERVFEPFSSSKPDGEGHGLGLGIVRWILQEHGGDVRIASPGPGKGSRVTVVLPLASRA